MTAICHLCGASNVKVVPAYAEMKRITSDCKPWLDGGAFGVCPDCGYSQTLVNEKWRKEISQIYADYTVYYQADGQEQSVFDAATGTPSLRSDLLMRRLRGNVPLPVHGALLDVGCGNGNFLRAFEQQIPQWNLHGCEWDDKHLSDLKKIQGFDTLHLCSPEKVPGTYDLISLIHCLEHLPDPVKHLSNLRPLLKADGLLLIEVPDCRVNPFMLLVADHCTHFSQDSLEEVVMAAGYEVVVSTNQWIPKELTIVARRGSGGIRRPKVSGQDAVHQERFISWLGEVSNHARELEKSGGLGIFGTSLASIWLQGQLDSPAKYFVDEDPHRIGRQHCGATIFSPEQAPKDYPVYLALAPFIAESVYRRLGSIVPKLIQPPPFL